MRTNIVINDEVMDEALSLSKNSTKKAVVEEALKMYIRLKKQASIRNLRGKLVWDGNLNESRM